MTSYFQQLNFIINQKQFKTTGVVHDLYLHIKDLKTEQNARSFVFMLKYYGLTQEKENYTLELIGEKEGGLTRERVRQIINNAVQNIMKNVTLENPFEKIKKIFIEKKETKEEKYLTLAELMEDEYFIGFKDNESGFAACINDADVRHVAYRGIGYVYPKNIKRSVAIEFIQKENKEKRSVKTKEKASKMTKTVTYVPNSTKDYMVQFSKKNGIRLNRLYEKVIAEFLVEVQKNGCKEFTKTQSWKARQGKSEWKQVGLYIRSDIFESSKKMATALKKRNQDVSTMGFICQAFMEFQSGLIKI